MLSPLTLPLFPDLATAVRRSLDLGWVVGGATPAGRGGASSGNGSSAADGSLVSASLLGMGDEPEEATATLLLAGEGGAGSFPPAAAAAASASASAEAGGESDMGTEGADANGARPRSPSDMRAFKYLSQFVCALLPAVGAGGALAPWAPGLLVELVALSGDR